MATRAERRIAGTWRGDRPYAVSADQGTLLWATRNACGDEHEPDPDAPDRFCLATMTGAARSAERPGGTECVSTCRSRWSTYHSKKKTTHPHDSKRTSEFI